MKPVKILLTCFFLGFSYIVLAQDDEKYYESLLREEVKVENPSYMPVVGIGVGNLNFFGNINNNLRGGSNGLPGFKLDITSFLDKKHYFKLDLSILIGTLTSNQYSASDTMKNLNFSSSIDCFGLNFQYDFKHFIKESSWLHPYVSVGVENIQYDSKTDLFDSQNRRYQYWTDGTIRNFPQSEAGTAKNILILHRSFNYNTNLNQGLSQDALSFPIEYGLDFKISERINLHIGQAWHFTTTKNIDSHAWQSSYSNYQANNKFDKFSFTSFSFHFDLFSDPKTKTIQKLFVEIDNYDYEMLDDEDNDGVYDYMDECPGTPQGVAVDSVGCPFDTDKDGVPDYRDKEPNTPPGSMVDDDGVHITPEEMAEKLKTEAIDRKDVEAFLLLHKAQNRYKGKPTMPLPEKFKSLDLDGDGYISFDELLKAIDDYFDFNSKLSTKDIYELQDFFFEQ